MALVFLLIFLQLACARPKPWSQRRKGNTNFSQLACARPKPWSQRTQKRKDAFLAAYPGWLAGWLTLSLPPKRFRNLHPDPCEAWRALVHSDVRGRVFTTCTPNAANPAAQAVSSGMSKCKVYLHARVARFLIPALATPPGLENKKDTIFKTAAFAHVLCRFCLLCFSLPSQPCRSVTASPCKNNNRLFR